MKMHDDLQQNLQELKASDPLKPDPAFIQETKTMLASKNYSGRSNKRIPLVSFALFIPICTLFLLSIDFSTITNNSSSSSWFQSSLADKKNTHFYIYHTHSSESFLPELDETDPAKAFDENSNIIKVGDYLASYLEKENFEVFHDETNFMDIAIKKDKSFQELYGLSRKNLTNFLDNTELNKENIIFLDIHRNSLDKETTTSTMNGKTSAKITFVVSKLSYYYEDNHRLAKNLNDKINDQYPGLSRIITKEKAITEAGAYNQDLSPNTLLINIGGAENTLKEEKRTVNILANALDSLVE
ncbi:stage II sporulation protein P [Halobacillus salinarum]|uniref:Stage II sporulation protein P n=1 Tax=Halobacillus salinarum TaxID=2932257 RepID=A0ABY4EPB8_9BACI|nr:stage II sporulation protein P [Halobacillus salinarum]UOQ45479.1 stage II sporulation protein P [Halobacillus salinarum]